MQTLSPKKWYYFSSRHWPLKVKLKLWRQKILKAISSLEFHWIPWIQKWYVITSTTYLERVPLPLIVTENPFSLLILVRYVSPLITLNRYLSRGSCRKLIFYHLIWKYTSLHTWGIPGIHTTFGLCHNLLNSVKVIWETQTCRHFLYKTSFYPIQLKVTKF